jgi:Acetyltransferase (GNAT) domain
MRTGPVRATIVTDQRLVSAPMPVSVISPAPRDVWDRLVASDPNSLPTQTGRWLDAICAVAGLEDASRMYQAADGRRLVLPLVRRRALGIPLVEASLPYGWGPGGLLAEGGLVRADDVRAVFADLATSRVPLVRLRPSPATGRIWEEAAPAAAIRRALMAQTVNLRDGFDQVWHARFRGDTRTRVRRAERHGVVVDRDDTGRLVPVFQELYRKSVARWARHDGRPLILARWHATQQEPDHKLPLVSATMGDSCRTYVAYVKGRPAAAIVVLLGESSAAYWRGAMDEEAIGKTYANYLLHGTAIKDASAAGCSAYHMGDSAPGSKLALFKSRFGAEERHYASYRVERLPLTAATDAARGVLGQAFRRWRGRP